MPVLCVCVLEGKRKPAFVRFTYFEMTLHVLFFWLLHFVWFHIIYVSFTCSFMLLMLFGSLVGVHNMSLLLYSVSFLGGHVCQLKALAAPRVSEGWGRLLGITGLTANVFLLLLMFIYYYYYCYIVIVIIFISLPYFRAHAQASLKCSCFW